ncbi:MAG: ribbon-helix-helix domain-containing protein [Candidatus Bathyarchaeia archaeon]
MKKRIIFRVPDAMYEQVQEAVKKGLAKTPSELIRAALKQFLSQN